MTRVLAVAKKEFLHIRRDARTLFVAIAMPIAMLMLYGYAIDMDLKQVRIAVLDEDRTPESRDLLARMTAGNTFRITTILTNREEFSDGFAANRYRAIVAIAPGFGEDIATHRDARFQV
ncbi:MAG: ABC transporter permease, partial [bacterium]|nr:ABC transporter permease [bacterium]